MDRNDIDWRGLWPATVTPFTQDGSLDHHSFDALLRYWVDSGMHGVVVNGSNGEWYAQSASERKQVAEIAVRTVAGRIPVVVGCAAFTAADVIGLARHAKAVGADGIMVSPPPYARLTPAEALHFYREVDSGVDLPLMVYNMPPLVALDMGPGLILQLCELDHVVAIKDSTPNQAQFFESLTAVVRRIRVFGNFVNPIGIAALREIGGDGVITGAVMLGREEADFFNAFWAGDLDRARGIAGRVARLNRLLFTPEWSGRHASGQSEIKAVYQLLGIPGGQPRPPRLPLTDPDALDEIREILVAEGLIGEVPPSRLRAGVMR